MGELPPSGSTGTIWLHDDCGARSVADAWVVIAGVERLDWRIVLTGRAVDGGHPKLGTTLHVDEDHGPSGGWTTVHQPEVDDPLAMLAMLADVGDLAKALARYEQVQQNAPDAARPWCWLELARLRKSGRTHEALALFNTHPDRHHAPVRFRLERALAALDLGELERARVLAADVLDETGNADASYILARERAIRGLHGEPHEPETTYWKAIAYDQLAAGGDQEARRRLDALDGPGFAGLVARGDLTSRSLASIGICSTAASFASETGPAEFIALYETSPVRISADRALDALRRGDPESAARDLEESASQVVPSELGVGHTLLSGRAQAALGQVGPLLRSIEQFQRIGPAFHLDPDFPTQVGPDASSDTWCAVTWLRALVARFGDRWSSEVERFPERPIALGPYRLHEPIGSGGMAVIWRGEHVLTGTPVHRSP